MQNIDFHEWRIWLFKTTGAVINANQMILVKDYVSRIVLHWFIVCFLCILQILIKTSELCIRRGWMLSWYVLWFVLFLDVVSSSHVKLWGWMFCWYCVIVLFFVCFGRIQLGLIMLTSSDSILSCIFWKSTNFEFDLSLMMYHFKKKCWTFLHI